MFDQLTRSHPADAPHPSFMEGEGPGVSQSAATAAPSRIASMTSA